MHQVRAIAVFLVFWLLTDFVCLCTYGFCLSLRKIVRSSVILLLPLFTGKRGTISIQLRVRNSLRFSHYIFQENASHVK